MRGDNEEWRGQRVRDALDGYLMLRDDKAQ